MKENLLCIFVFGDRYRFYLTVFSLQSINLKLR